MEDEDGVAQGLNVVVVMPGNSLVMQTTGDPNLPVDQYAIDLGDQIRWEVSEGGRIFISTNSASSQKDGTAPE